MTAVLVASRLVGQFPFEPRLQPRLLKTYIRALYAHSGSCPPESSCRIEAMIVFRTALPRTTASWLSAELWRTTDQNNLNFQMAIWRFGANPFANLGSEFRRCISGNSPGTIRVPFCDLLLFSDAQSRRSRLLDRRFPALRSTQMSFALTYDHSLGRPGSKLPQQKTLPLRGARVSLGSVC